MTAKVQKKRSNSESAADPESVGQSPPKKQKKLVANGVANGVPKPAAEGEPLTPSQKKRQKNKARKLAAIARVIESGGVPKPFHRRKEKRTEAEKAAQPKPRTAEEKMKAKLEKQAEAKKLRQEKRQAEGQYRVDQVSLGADEIRLRIAEIKGRGAISKTAKRKLGVLLKKLAIEEGTAVPETKGGKAKNGEAGLTKSEKKRSRQKKEDSSVEKLVDIQSFELKKKKNEKNEQGAGGKNKTVPPKIEKQGKGKKKIEESEDEEEEEEEEGSSEEEEEEEEEVVQKPVAKKAKKEKNQEAKKESNQDQNNPDKKQRYIFFVGNVPFDAKPEDIKSHFLTKVGEVSSVRIPTNPGTQTPRGFCYVEVTNNVDYEKGLSLHHTFINGRRINVEYTLAGSKQVSKRQELVSKNHKLHAMRKAGQLVGSQKHDQKRSVRRFKQREQPRTPN